MSFGTLKLGKIETKGTVSNVLTGLFTQMAPVGGLRDTSVHMYMLHVWLPAWWRAAERDSPWESYFLLLLFEYGKDDTLRLSLQSKSLENRVTGRV